jgi:hypothetical protein
LSGGYVWLPTLFHISGVFQPVPRINCHHSVGLCALFAGAVADSVAAAGAADKVVSSTTSATKALPTKGLSQPVVPRAVKKTFTPPARVKKDIGINAGGEGALP